MNKIDEIKQALAAATPGPWEYEVWQGFADVYPTTGRHVPICQLWTKTEEPMENAENNAHLIANAPEWLHFLLNELAEERAAHNAHVTELCELEQERDKLIECLRWYADKKNYEYRTSYLDQDAPIINDSGQRARDILAEIGVTTE